MIMKELEEALLSLDRIKVESILYTQSSKSSFIDVLDNIVTPTMENMGKKWEKGDIALSQMYMGGKILEEMVDLLIPQTDTSRKSDPKLGLIVYKDYHQLGKRIVYTFLRASGYDVEDYGPQHDIDDIIDLIRKNSIEILLISVLMLNSALNIKELIKRIKDAKISVKVIVGGAPFRFDKELYKEIGADAFATEASQVIDIIENLRG